MNLAKRCGWTAAFLAALHVGAAAQVDVVWNPYPELSTRPVTFRPGDPLPEFSGGTLPGRPLLFFEDTEEDRERRRETLSKCLLLSDVGGRTILDVVAGIPNTMIDLVAGGIQPPPDRHESWTFRSPEGGSVLGRVFSCSLKEASSRPFEDLMGQLIIREQKYFSRFQDSNLSTFGVEDGLEDIDADKLMGDQRKLLFDAAKKIYFGRLGRGLDDRIRDDTLDIGNWHPVDYVVAPAMIAGYLYVRGWEKKMDMLGLTCGLQIEPLRRILERLQGSHNDLAAAASLEFGLGDFPVKAIVSFGIEDGDGLVDFIGLGTSLGKAKQIVEHEMGEAETD